MVFADGVVGVARVGVGHECDAAGAVGAVVEDLDGLNGADAGEELLFGRVSCAKPSWDESCAVGWGLGGIR